MIYFRILSGRKNKEPLIATEETKIPRYKLLLYITKNSNGVDSNEIIKIQKVIILGQNSNDLIFVMVKKKTVKFENLNGIAKLKTKFLIKIS